MSAVSLADRIVLQNGRVLTGIVKYDGDNVLVEMSGVTLSFPKDQVLRVDIQPTPLQEFSAKLAQTSLTDAQAMFALAQWASANGLDKQALELAGKIILLNPEHVGARQTLGQVKLDGQWLYFAQAMELAKGKLEAGQYDALLRNVLPTLEGIASTKDKLCAVKELQVAALLRTRDFAQAAKVIAAALESAEPPASIRLAALAEILQANPDGMFVLTEDYSPSGILSTAASGPALKAGPASLADPLVVQAALRERAKRDLEAGRKLMDAARRADASDVEVAKLKYVQAGLAFDKADALVENISRSYRIEIARRRIAAIRRDTDADAERFDRALSKLGKTNLSGQEYQNMILNLVRLLDNVRDNLGLVMSAGKAYPKELVLELKWAELDLKKLEGMRKILLDELNGTK